MSKVLIGYKQALDYLSSYTFAVGVEDPDQPFANAYDRKLYDFMKLAASASAYEIEVTLSAAQKVDFLAFYKTNLAAIGGSIKLQYWTGSAWADASTTISPTDTAPVLKTFTQRNTTQYKLIINNNNQDAYIADITFGEYITTEFGLYIGYSNPIFARTTKYVDNKSNDGLMLGRSVRYYGFKSTCDFEFMTDAYVRATWIPFVKHAELYPFYFAWNFTDYPLEIAYCNTSGDIPAPVETNPGRCSVNLPLVGFTI